MNNKRNFVFGEKPEDYGSALYKALVEICPELENCENVYCKLEDGEYSLMEPFTIERHGSTVFAAHTYVQDGDLMYDPAVEFLFDTKNKTARAITYELSVTGVYRDLRGEDKQKLRAEVEETALNSMLENVKSYDYESRKLIVEDDEEE